MQLPLLFSFRQVVFGDGFVAGVSMEGRALLEEDGPDGPWISGVAPVGFAAGGVDRSDAFTEFRNAWITVLFDIAAEARSFDAFKQSCTEFLNSTEPTLSAEWDAALLKVRATNYVDPTMRREPVEAHKTGFEVVNFTLHQPKSENRLEAGVKVAA